MSSTYVWNDYIITLDSKTYSGTQFTAAVASKITAASSGAVVTASYDTQSKIMSISVSNLEIYIYTDEDIKDPLMLTFWNGATPYDVNNLNSVNELITNVSPSPNGTTAEPAEYHLMLTPVRNIYMRSPNMSSFNTIGCNGESSIIKKLPVNAAPGEMIVSYITSSTDYLSCSRATWKSLEFIITDVNGTEIPLHGVNWSFSVFLDIMNPNI